MEDRQFAIIATPVEVAPIVDRGLWPVHVTPVGNFRVGEVPDGDISAGLASAVREVSSFEVPLGPQAQFGVERNVPVLLAEHPMFHNLHALLAEHVERLRGFAAAEPVFWGAGYRPHATLGAAVDVSAGELLKIKWVTLVSLKGPTGRRLSAVRLDSR